MKLCLRKRGYREEVLLNRGHNHERIIERYSKVAFGGLGYFFTYFSELFLNYLLYSSRDAEDDTLRAVSHNHPSSCALAVPLMTA